MKVGDKVKNRATNKILGTIESLGTLDVARVGNLILMVSDLALIKDEKRLDVVDELMQSIVTATNDDFTKPLSEGRNRHINRIETMREAAIEIRRLRMELEEEKQGRYLSETKG